jgi:8-oxo-dGTP pyrophosphatase MutT (NUDIX family)
VDGAAIPMHGRLTERGREVLAGRRPPVAARDAATVMLLRPSGAAAPEAAGVPAPEAPGIEVYMLRRKTSMAFAPGGFVFPGGSVDDRDADSEVAWAGPDIADWGRVLDAPPELARALVCAAVRETFEESGVLLAGPSAGAVVPDTTGEDWEADRNALLDRSLSLAGLLGRRRLVLRSDLLKPWSRWITPVAEERRYDARFFAAALPSPQQPRDVGGEAAALAWVRPADAIAAARGNQIVLLPPTAVTLAELAACASVSAALAAAREVIAVMPGIVQSDDGVWLTLPAALGYPL